jgi:hypothetical protein
MSAPVVGGFVNAFTIADEFSRHLTMRVREQMMQIVEENGLELPITIIIATELTQPEAVANLLAKTAERVPACVPVREKMKHFHFVIWVDCEAPIHPGTNAVN